MICWSFNAGLISTHFEQLITLVIKLEYFNILAKNGEKFEAYLNKKYLPQGNLSNYLKLFVGPRVSGFTVKKLCL
jgi:hypothetical protein